MRAAGDNFAALQAWAIPDCPVSLRRHFNVRISHSLLIDLALIQAMLLVGVAGYKLSPLLLPKADLQVAPVPGCDLNRGVCRAPLPGGGELRFLIAAQPIPVAAPFDMVVHVEGQAVDRVTVDFAGVSMNMGFNRLDLHADGPGRFAGRATLPVCVTGRMTWQATVLLEGGGHRLAVPFRFDAGH